MTLPRILILACATSALALAAEKPEFRVGVARVKITPTEPIWMAGYGNRNKPSEGVAMELWAKALAIEDKKGFRVVLVTTDVLGLPRSITDAVAARIEKQHSLRRAQVLFNSSHTHAGPVIRPSLRIMAAIEEAEERKLTTYQQKLTDDLFTVAGAALGDLQPATMSFGQGAAHFTINRRQFTRQGVIIGVNPEGATDPAVPVIEVKTTDGKRKAVLFGYACHNTTLGGDYYRIHGDYAGRAQAEIERQHPGVTALFLMLCGGDQNPNPRGTTDLADKHGRDLAAIVNGVLGGSMESLRSPIRAAFRVTELNFAPHTREQYEQEAKDTNQFRVRRARMMLALYDETRPIRQTPYPVQAIRFQNGVTLLALGGEVVVDYALRAKREFTRDRLVVAGYSNDVMCYIPSRKVLREGGYEADMSMVYYGQPGKFADDVEDLVFEAIRPVMKRVGAK